MKLVIDRFEGEYAIIELTDGRTASIPRIAIPPEAKESDILSIEIQKRETEARNTSIHHKINSLFSD